MMHLVLYEMAKPRYTFCDRKKLKNGTTGFDNSSINFCRGIHMLHLQSYLEKMSLQSVWLPTNHLSTDQPLVQ